MVNKHSISLIIAVALITPITVFALVNWMEKKWRPLPVFEGKDQRLYDFQLTDQHNNTITLQQWKGKIVVANFFFTRCPVICPKMTATLQTVKAAFAGNENLQFHSFSVDPERDSVPRLKAFAKRFDINGNWHLLTGSKPAIYHLARHAFAVAASEGEGGDGDFIHSEKLVLIDGKLKIRGYYHGTSPAAAQQLIEDIKKLKDEN